MKNKWYVASGLVMSLLLSAPPALGQDADHMSAQTSDDGESSRPIAQEDILSQKKYNLIDENVFVKELNKVKVKKLTAEGTDESAKEVEIESAGVDALKKFQSMTQNLRLKLQQCSIDDNSANAFKEVMDAMMNFFAVSLTTDGKLKVERIRIISEKHFATYLWALEAFFTQQKEKQLSNEENMWNKDYLDAAKAAFKTLVGQDFELEKWRKWNDKFNKVGKNTSNQALKEMLENADKAKTAIDAKQPACLVQVNPAASPSSAPEKSSEPTKSPEATTPAKPVEVGPGAPLPATSQPQPSSTVVPSPTSSGEAPQPTAVTDPNSNQGPAAPNANDLLRSLGEDITNGARQEADDLRRKLADLQDLFNRVKQRELDRLNFLNDPNRNDDAARDAVAALGRGNDNPPQVPPPVIPPQIPPSEDRGNDTPPLTTPPPADDVAQQPAFNPYAMMGQQQPQMPPIVINRTDKDDKQNAFADLAAKNTPQPLPEVSERKATLDAMRETIQLQTEQLRNRLMGAGRWVGQWVNNLASRVSSFARNRMSSPRGAGNALSGTQNGPNNLSFPGRTKAIPDSLRRMNGRI